MFRIVRRARAKKVLREWFGFDDSDIFGPVLDLYLDPSNNEWDSACFYILAGANAGTVLCTISLPDVLAHADRCNKASEIRRLCMNAMRTL
jgi:hypothetical protein